MLTAAIQIHVWHWTRPSFLVVGLSTWKMNFTSSEYLYPHSFTLPMVTCTVQKVGQRSVDFHGNGMCLYNSSISWLRGNSLKIGLQYLVKQWLVFELCNYISSYVSHLTNSKSRRKPLAGIVRSGSLIRVSQVLNIIHYWLRQCLDRIITNPWMHIHN